MEKLWKSYGISFLGICTNPDTKTTFLEIFFIGYHFITARTDLSTAIYYR